MSNLLIPQSYDHAVPVERLQRHPRNPREGDVGAIYGSIIANQFYGAVIAQRSTGYILAGNHRYQAALEAGLKTLPVIWIDCDDERALRILLADNRTNDKASYNSAELRELLDFLGDCEDGLTGTGWEPEDLEALTKDLDTPLQMDPAPAAPADKPKKAPKSALSMELHFDGDEQFGIFRAGAAALRERYPQHDSFEARLVAFFEETLL